MRAVIVACLLMLIAARSSAHAQEESSAARNLAVFGGALGSAAVTGGLCLGAGRATERDDEPTATQPSVFTGPPYYDPYDRPARYELDLEWYAWSAICYAMLAPFAISGGTTLVGHALDGQGEYWAAAGGVGLGLASAAVTTLLASAASDGGRDETHGAAVVSLALLPALGAALFYALSHDAEASRAPLAVIPLASVVEGGRGLWAGARASF